MRHMSYFNRDNRSGGNRNFGRRSFGDRGDRQMFSAICSDCGKECQVPFQPTGSKPVFCSDCFEKKGPRREDGRTSGRSDFRGPTSDHSDQNKAQLDAISVKLDKIIRLLEPKAQIVSEPIIEKVEEVKAPKAKKAKNP